MDIFEMLNNPLPSKSKSVETFESVMDDLTSVVEDEEIENEDDIDFDIEDEEETEDEIEDEIEDDIEDSDDEVVDELDDAEDAEVDAALDAIAPTILLQDELSDEEKVEFVESAEMDILEEEGLISERTIIKFDKNAKKAQLYEVAWMTIARSKKDKDMRKLDMLYKMERVLKAKLRKRYHQLAIKKVKEWMGKKAKSKSGLIRRIVNKLSNK
jgi:hypothetical protein